MISRKLILIILIVCVLVPSVFAYNYIQNDPRFCTGCHLMNPAYGAWQISAMHDVNCHKCHEAGIKEGLGHMIDVITKNPKEVTVMAEVPNEICENCHTSEDPNWLQVVNTSGHKVHFFGKAQPPECIHCHGIQLHVFEPPEEVCSECHNNTIMMGEPETQIHCLVCHDFTVQKENLFPLREDCLECHEDKEIVTVTFPSKVHANSTCSECHNPHVQEKYIDCVTCHDVAGQGLHQQTAHSNCVTCHIPHSSESMRDICIKCHIDKDEHFSPIECATCHSFIS